jgi:flagellin
MLALENLNSTNAQLQKTQNIISTGKKVNTAADNGSTWAIAQSETATSNSLDAVVDSLQRGQSTISVATSAGTTVSDLLSQMKEKALAASDTTLDTTSRAALNSDFMSLRDQIGKVVSNADFNGANMLKSGGVSVQALANAAGSSKLTVAAEDLSLGGANLTTSLSATSSLGTAGTAATMVSTLTTAISNVNNAMAKLGTGSNELNSQLTFTQNLQDTLNTGVGNLVDADMAKESATLQALQTKQQLGVQALSIANQSTSALLGLFR